MKIEGNCEMYLDGKSIATIDALISEAAFSYSAFARHAVQPADVTGVITTRWSREDADNFFRALEGRLHPPEYRQRGLRIEVASRGEIAFSAPGGLQGSGKMWVQVAEARSQHTHVRLRRFVNKGGRAVEVRARGRCGSRSLMEALEQANASMIGNSITLEGTIK